MIRISTETARVERGGNPGRRAAAAIAAQPKTVRRGHGLHGSLGVTATYGWAARPTCLPPRTRPPSQPDRHM